MCDKDHYAHCHSLTLGLAVWSSISSAILIHGLGIPRVVYRIALVTPRSRQWDCWRSHMTCVWLSIHLILHDKRQQRDPWDVEYGMTMISIWGMGSTWQNQVVKDTIFWVQDSSQLSRTGYSSQHARVHVGEQFWDQLTYILTFGFLFRFFLHASTRQQWTSDTAAKKTRWVMYSFSLKQSTSHLKIFPLWRHLFACKCAGRAAVMSKSLHHHQ